jgi:uncharacterized caspase-like protein
MNPVKLFMTGLMLVLVAWQGANAQISQLGAKVAPQKGASAAAPAGKRYALVIGNATYVNASPLANPVNDARAVCKTLKELQFDVDCRENVTRRGGFKQAISDFTHKIKPADVALFYFAGHGVELNGENFLIPTEASIRSKADVEDETVRVNFVYDELSAAKALLSIIILDACRDNPFRSFRSGSSGLTVPTSVTPGSITIFPTSPGRAALDGSGKNGVFTSHLLKHMSTPGINIEEMFKRVSSGVQVDAIAAGIEQIPWINQSFTGEFCFFGCGTRISAEDYQAVVSKKEEIERTTQTLQGELASRESELQQFRTRMVSLQQQLEVQRRSESLSLGELQNLGRQRDELAAKTVNLESQEQELKRVKLELQRFQSKQVDFAKRETEMADARDRIAALEMQIALTGTRKRNDAEMDVLRRERDSLVKNNSELQAQQKSSEAAWGEVATLQQRLKTYDQQRGELDAYKLKLSQLEVENRKKDESVLQMRMELEQRQTALTGMRERMESLQTQLNQQRSGQASTAQDQQRIQSEREELKRRGEQLAARERDLAEARNALAKAETQGNEQQAKQELIALKNRLSEYDKQKNELDGYKQQMARMEEAQLKIQFRLKQAEDHQKETEAKLVGAKKNTVKDAAVVSPAF